MTETVDTSKKLDTWKRKVLVADTCLVGHVDGEMVVAFHAKDGTMFAVGTFKPDQAENFTKGARTVLDEIRRNKVDLQ